MVSLSVVILFIFSFKCKRVVIKIETFSLGAVKRNKYANIFVPSFYYYIRNVGYKKIRSRFVKVNIRRGSFGQGVNKSQDGWIILKYDKIKIV